MGLFDDALRNAVPGGDVTKPLAIAVGALVLGKMLSGHSAPPPPQAPANAGQANMGSDGGLLGGLGGLLGKLQDAGHGNIANSWIGSGQNTPIQPGQLGSALGQQTISDLARQSGMSEQDLLNQLSQVLPGLVDKLTPNGRLPTAAELGR
ncbi:MAG TPA: YidB family protein [Beijerinckiaceae bacterium]|jgi:uncharacterized protein YidB (DUF937 family)|nr:YidB family protein [Beijerinckiaceae bacterium]